MFTVFDSLMKMTQHVLIFRHYQAAMDGSGVMFSGSAEWLYCKSRVCRVSSVIHDLDQCSQYMDCMETRLICDTLVLMKPSLDFLYSHMGQLFWVNFTDHYAISPFPAQTFTIMLCFPQSSTVVGITEPFETSRSKIILNSKK